MYERVLIVDDEPNLCLELRLSLATEAYEISEAHSALEALELLAVPYPAEQQRVRPMSWTVSDRA